jgi:hypothetical protein
MQDTVCASKPEVCVLPAGPHGFSEILKLVSVYAPFKQVDPKTGLSNKKIGRAPGSACEAMRFLTKVVTADPAATGARAKLIELADWIVDLQSREQDKPWFGGVPSTPDLTPPANRYHYTIDAAFCGDAMIRAHRLLGSEKYRASALAFAQFIARMHRGQDAAGAIPRGAGFCEFVVADGGRGTWNCNQYVKNMLALPVLAWASQTSGDPIYSGIAEAARAYLIDGLTQSFEYAQQPATATCKGRPCATTWRRIDGPHRERDFFVYGDTIAYALRGLYEYQGITREVEMVYNSIVAYKGSTAKSRPYDGRIALAGYLIPQTGAPDDFSAYYDLVTMGILHELRLAHWRPHFDIASGVIEKIVAKSAALPWKMNFDLSLPAVEFADTTTLANLGEAMLAISSPRAKPNLGKSPPQ